MLESKEQDVDFFILYSSITSVLGNTGQTTYAAANSFMNSFADYRKKVLGKNCLSICWGAMGGAGILERNAKVASLLEQTGLHLLDIPKGMFNFTSPDSGQLSLVVLIRVPFQILEQSKSLGE